MTKLTEKKRVFGYDALKALAAFFVVLYHVGMVDMGYRDGQYYYPTLVQVLWLFCACSQAHVHCLGIAGKSQRLAFHRAVLPTPQVFCRISYKSSPS